MNLIILVLISILVLSLSHLLYKFFKHKNKNGSHHCPRKESYKKIIENYNNDYENTYDATSAYSEKINKDLYFLMDDPNYSLIQDNIKYTLNNLDNASLNVNTEDTNSNGNLTNEDLLKQKDILSNILISPESDVNIRAKNLILSGLISGGFNFFTNISNGGNIVDNIKELGENVGISLILAGAQRYGLGPLAQSLLSVITKTPDTKELIDYDKITNIVSEAIIDLENLQDIRGFNIVYLSLLNFLAVVYYTEKVNLKITFDNSLSLNTNVNSLKVLYINDPKYDPNCINKCDDLKNIPKRSYLQEVLQVEGGIAYNIFLNDSYPYGFNWLQSIMDKDSGLSYALLNSYLSLLALNISWKQEISLYEDNLENNYFINPWLSLKTGDISLIGQLQAKNSLIYTVQTLTQDLFAYLVNLYQMYYNNLSIKFYEPNQLGWDTTNLYKDDYLDKYLNSANRAKSQCNNCPSRGTCYCKSYGYYSYAFFYDSNNIITEPNPPMNYSFKYIKKYISFLGKETTCKTTRCSMNDDGKLPFKVDTAPIYTERMTIFRKYMNQPFTLLLPNLKRMAGIKDIYSGSQYGGDVDFNPLTPLVLGTNTKTTFTADGGYPFGLNNLSYKDGTKYTQTNPCKDINVIYKMGIYPSPKIYPQFNNEYRTDGYSYSYFDGTILNGDKSLTHKYSNTTIGVDKNGEIAPFHYVQSFLIPGLSPGMFKTPYPCRVFLGINTVTNSACNLIDYNDYKNANRKIKNNTPVFDISQIFREKDVRAKLTKLYGKDILKRDFTYGDVTAVLGPYYPNILAIYTPLSIYINPEIFIENVYDTSIYCFSEQAYYLQYDVTKNPETYLKNPIIAKLDFKIQLFNVNDYKEIIIVVDKSLQITPFGFVDNKANVYKQIENPENPTTRPPYHPVTLPPYLPETLPPDSYLLKTLTPINTFPYYTNPRIFRKNNYFFDNSVDNSWKIEKATLYMTAIDSFQKYEAFAIWISQGHSENENEYTTYYNVNIEKTPTPFILKMIDIIPNSGKFTIRVFAINRTDKPLLVKDITLKLEYERNI